MNTLKGVGPRTIDHLSRLNIHSIQDLWFHLPLRYQDRTRISSVSALQLGDEVLIEGKIQFGKQIYRGHRNFLCHITDDTGHIVLRFFHFSAEQERRLSTPGLKIRCFGQVRQNFHGGFEIIHPEYHLVQASDPLHLEDRLTPIYPTTKGLAQVTWRKLTGQALDVLESTSGIIELLPESLLKEFQLPSLKEALLYVHRPPPKAPTDMLQKGLHPMQQRLAFEELMTHQLGLQQLRFYIKQQLGIPLPCHSELNLQGKLEKQLPFQLTSAQRHVIAEINQDLAKAKPMLRLVQGDVGSGKTVVAMMAALRAVEHGYQVAVMAPTELLVEQHRHSFENWLKPLGISIGWLSGSQLSQERSDALEKIKQHDAQVVVGTHALFQKNVVFSALGLIIIDEQHRFGVHQRLALREKGITDGRYPHQLIMTATPIPRTLAMAAYADLDMSVIDELPPGRKPVTTSLIDNQHRRKVIHRLASRCAQGKQAYWVCTLIEDSQVLQCQAAEATAQELQHLSLGLKIGLIHGRCKADQKEQIMNDFRNGNIHVLVATTVIEVGVDVPNASLMIIENSERLGLSQLHQLRGRIGRGSEESHCVLLYQEPLSLAARQRLAILKKTTDGFLVAQKDLSMRGPGEILGIRQAGLLQLQIADVLRDKKLLPHVRQAGELIVREYPDRVDPLMRRWLHGLEQFVEV